MSERLLTVAEVLAYEAGYDARSEEVTAEIARLTAKLDAARELIREMTGAEPVFKDARVGYVEVQIGLETWEEARALAAARRGEGGE